MAYRDSLTHAITIAAIYTEPGHRFADEQDIRDTHDAYCTTCSKGA